MSKQSNIILNWVLPGVAAVVVAAVVLAWQWPRITGAPAPANTQPAATANSPAQSFAFADTQSSGTALAQSADHVRVLALRDGDTVTARITIDDGWHINTNPASLEFLIPTALTLHSNDKPLDATVSYPAGETIDVGLDQPIDVFSDSVDIVAQTENAAANAPIQAVVRVQACSNKGRCLVPSTIKMPALTQGS